MILCRVAENANKIFSNVVNDVVKGNFFIHKIKKMIKYTSEKNH